LGEEITFISAINEIKLIIGLPHTGIGLKLAPFFGSLGIFFVRAQLLCFDTLL
jgi:hypothetical protein